MADYQLPDSASKLIDPKDPLLEATHPFDMVKDAGGSDSIGIKVPTGLKRLMEMTLVEHPAGLRTISDMGRAAIGHFMKHLVERLADPYITQEWLSLAALERSARYARGYAELEDTVEHLGSGLRMMLERGDTDSIVDTLEEYFTAVRRIPDVHRRKATLEIALHHPNVHRAALDVAKQSKIVREALEEV